MGRKITPTVFLMIRCMQGIRIAWGERMKDQPSADSATRQKDMKSNRGNVSREWPLVAECLWCSAARNDGWAALVIAGIGFTPIAALSLALMDFCRLPIATMLLVVPALLLAAVMIGLGCGYGSLMLRGFLMGLGAVAVYDAVRIPFTLAGWMEDFIPRIGLMLLGECEHAAVVGYLWRYLGNGGGMGMAFVCGYVLLRNKMGFLKGVSCLWCAYLFGLLVWVCLIVTLILSPQSEKILFAITPTSLLLSGIGHGVFGGTLGCLLSKFPCDWTSTTR